MTSNFPTSGSLSNLRHLLPNTETPWKLSVGVEGRLEVTAPQGNLSYKRCQILPMDKEWDFVCASFEAQRPKKYGIKRIWAVQQKGQTQTFEHHLSNVESLGATFKPDWQNEASRPQREKIIQRWKRITDFYAPFQLEERRAIPFTQAKVLPLWHGSSEGKCQSICESGFIIPGKHNVGQGIQTGAITDVGFFGSGIYFTTSARYAVDIYSRGHLLLAWVSMREPFPVVKEDMKLLEGKGSYKMHDAHYIPVAPKNSTDPYCPDYYPCNPAEDPICDEFVVFQNAQTKTHFWIELQVDLPYSLSTIPQTVGELLDLVFQVLQEASVKNDSDLQEALKRKADALLVLRTEALLSDKDRPFLESLTSLFEVKRKVEQVGRGKLLDVIAKHEAALSANLSDELQVIQDAIDAADFKLAWQTLLLFSQFLFTPPLNAAYLAPIYGMVRSILPSLAFEEKTALFEKVIPPLRALNLPENQLYLERDLARWFLSLKEKKTGSALNAYIRALRHAERLQHGERDALYEEVSSFLSAPLLDPEKLKELQDLLGSDKEKIVHKLSFIRDNFCFTSQSRKKLIPLYKVALPLFINAPTSPLIPRIMEGITSEKGARTTPYIKRNPEAFYTAYQRTEQLWEWLFPLEETPFTPFLEALLHLEEVNMTALGGPFRFDWNLSELTDSSSARPNQLFQEIYQGTIDLSIDKETVKLIFNKLEATKQELILKELREFVTNRKELKIAVIVNCNILDLECFTPWLDLQLNELHILESVVKSIVFVKKWAQSHLNVDFSSTNQQLDISLNWLESKFLSRNDLETVFLENYNTLKIEQISPWFKQLPASKELNITGPILSFSSAKNSQTSSLKIDFREMTPPDQEIALNALKEFFLKRIDESQKEFSIAWQRYFDYSQHWAPKSNEFPQIITFVNCETLTSLTPWIHNELTHLNVKNCKNLKDFKSEDLSLPLQDLTFTDCDSLETIDFEAALLKNFTVINNKNLKEIKIRANNKDEKEAFLLNGHLFSSKIEGCPLVNSINFSHTTIPGALGTDLRPYLSYVIRHKYADKEHHFLVEKYFLKALEDKMGGPNNVYEAQPSGHMGQHNSTPSFNFNACLLRDPYLWNSLTLLTQTRMRHLVKSFSCTITSPEEARAIIHFLPFLGKNMRDFNVSGIYERQTISLVKAINNLGGYQPNQTSPVNLKYKGAGKSAYRLIKQLNPYIICDIDLSDNDLSGCEDECFNKLCGATGSIILSRTKISDKNGIDFGKYLSFMQARSLDLSGNNISNTNAIFGSLEKSSLTRLIIGSRGYQNSFKNKHGQTVEIIIR